MRSDFREQPQPCPHPSRCTSLRCAYQHGRLCGGLRFLRAPAWCSQTFTAVRLNRLLKPQVHLLGLPRGTGWLAPKMVWQYLSSHVPHPRLHTCHQTRCARLNESSLLTSSADKRDVTSGVALSANR
ncbi:hypothetical protein L3Q82_022857 [Scortum barcoo]|uniref:Uncharacterized protein n=1 Tax=Scortum barcoo TaxID=214431 RepID=A0ACB8WX51_9TELE|nr:hypothetical protein L3Q82_022857 [Scortum barcoo]